MRLLQNELKILRELKYCNIVRVYDVIETPERAFIVMEKCHGGDLFDRVMKYGGKTRSPFLYVRIWQPHSHSLSFDRTYSRVKCAPDLRDAY